MKKFFSSIFGIVLPVAFTILFLVIGTILKNDYNTLKETCTYPVTAIVVDYKESHDNDDNSTTYTPVFEYQYNEGIYRSNLDMYSSDYRSKYKINTSHDILINPDEPTSMFYEPISKSGLVLSTVLTIVGYILAAVSVIIIIINLVKGIVLIGLFAKNKQ